MEWRTFDAIYLINLPERLDRKRELESELRRVGLETNAPRLVWVRGVRPLDAGEFPSIGARGCFLSHLHCLELAVEQNHARILILEDDACFPRLRVNALQKAVASLENSEWAIWYGGGSVALDSKPADGNVEVFPIKPTEGVQTTHCVAFQRDTINSMLAFLQLILTRPKGHPEAGPMHVDGAYSTWRSLNPSAVTLVTVPPVCIQRSSKSDIAGPRWFDKNPLLLRSNAALRRLRNLLKHHR